MARYKGRIGVRVSAADKAALKYAGMMGHTYATIVTVNGERVLQSQTDNLADSVRFAALEEDPAYYHRPASSKRGWVRVYPVEPDHQEPTTEAEQ